MFFWKFLKRPWMIIILLPRVSSFNNSDIKNYMDKQFGPPWHCIVGKGFGSGVTYNNKNMIFLYICNKAILIFRH